MKTSLKDLIDIEKLQKVVELFEIYDEIRDKTRLEKILAQEEEKFSDIYKEINLKRSNEINPLTACAHGTNAAAVLSGIMFSGGELSPLNGVKQARVLDIHTCKLTGNQNFVSTVHLENAQDFRNKHSEVIAKRSEKRKQIIDRDHDEITFTLPLSFALSSKSPLSKTIFLKRIEKRCVGNEDIYNAMSDALDDDVLKYFEKLSKVPVLILGDGIGQYEGSDGLTLHWPRETLFKKFNIRIIAVKKEHRKLVEPLTKINPDFNIAIIDQEELLKFTKQYNAQFYDNSTTDKKNKYYNIECDKTTSESFMEALVKHEAFAKHFKLPPTFSEKVPSVTITQSSIYSKKSICSNKSLYSKKSTFSNGLGVVGRLDKIRYCAEGLEQRQKFYNENQIKNAIKKGEKIDDRDPIVYALLHGILLENKFPIIYAMENAIKIEGADPTLWAKKNKYDIEKKEPIAYAIEHAIKIEGKDPVLWAQENKYKIDEIDPIVYAMKQFYVGVGKKGVYKSIKIEGKSAKEWMSRAINNRREIGDKDAREWLIDTIKGATEKEGFDSLVWRIYPYELVDCAEENNITLEGKPVREWLRDKEAERKNPNKHKTEDIPISTIDPPTINPIVNQQLPIKVPVPGIEQAQNPTLVVHTDDQDSNPQEGLLKDADQDPTVEVPSIIVNIHEVDPQPKAEPIMTKLPISGADLKSQINDIFPMSQKRYSFENYQSGKGLVELSKERVDIVNKYIESIKKDFIESQFILKITYAQLCIKCELRCLSIDGNTLLLDGNTLLLKEYLEIVKQYNGWVSSIFDKYEKWNDVLRERNEKINRELARIEEILSSKTQKNEPATEVLQSEPEKSEAEEDPSPTVLTPEGDSQPETQLPDNVISPYATSKETEETDAEFKTYNGEKLKSEAPIYIPVAPSEDKNKNGVRENISYSQEKSKSNSKYYIVGCAIGGAIIGAVIAHCAGAAALTPVLAAVAVFIGAVVVGALLGAGIGYCISKCLDSPDVQSMSCREKNIII